MNWPPEGGAQDSWPTEELGPAWPGHGQPGAGPRRPGPQLAGPPLAGPQPASPQLAGPRPAGPQPAAARGDRLRRWGIGAAAATVLVLGGGAAAAALSGGSPSAPGSSGAPTTAMSALLSASSGSASGASSGAASGPAAAHRARCLQRAKRLRSDGHPLAAGFVLRRCARGARLRLLGGIHGQITFESKKGPRTVDFERGTISSVSGSSVVVSAADGTTWTWGLVGNTVVRQDHKKAAASALSAGQRVFVGGPMSGTARDARLIVIRPAAPAGRGSGSASGSSSGSSSSS